MTSIFKYFVVHALVILCVKNTVAVPQLGSKFGNVFDQELYQNVLDPVECNRQLTYMRSDTLLLARCKYFIKPYRKIIDFLLHTKFSSIIS